RATMPILDDLHKIAPLAGVEAVRTEVVQNEQIDPGQHAQEACEAAISMGELQLCEEARRARVVRPVALAAGPLGKGAGEAVFSANEKIAFFCDPAAGGELLEEGFVELTLCAVIDVLDRGLAIAQARRTQADLRALGRAIGDLPIEQECEPLGVCEIPGDI